MLLPLYMAKKKTNFTTYNSSCHNLIQYTLVPSRYTLIYTKVLWYFKEYHSPLVTVIRLYDPVYTTGVLLQGISTIILPKYMPKTHIITMAHLKKHDFTIVHV